MALIEKNLSLIWALMLHNLHEMRRNCVHLPREGLLNFNTSLLSPANHPSPNPLTPPHPTSSPPALVRVSVLARRQNAEAQLVVGVAEGLLDFQHVVGGAPDVVGRVVRVLDAER